MSASERLRALGDETVGACALLGVPLPLIADVVEAAERIENMMWDDEDDPLDAEEFGLRMAEVGRSLVALQDALEEQA